MKPPEKDDLWMLLGRTQPPPASPFFARNVIREIRTQPQFAPFPAWLNLLRTAFSRRWAPLTCTILILTGVATAWHPIQRNNEITVLAEAVSTSPDYAVIAQLEELLSSEETSVWLDAPNL